MVRAAVALLLAAIAQNPQIRRPFKSDPPIMCEACPAWNADREPATIERHKEVAENKGSVWWGRFGKHDTSGIASERVQAVLQGVGQRVGAVLAIEGVAGMGKSRLLEEARAKASRLGVRMRFVGR